MIDTLVTMDPFGHITLSLEVAESLHAAALNEFSNWHSIFSNKLKANVWVNCVELKRIVLLIKSDTTTV